MEIEQLHKGNELTTHINILKKDLEDVSFFSEDDRQNDTITFNDALDRTYSVQFELESHHLKKARDLVISMAKQEIAELEKEFNEL